ncbi:MAG TPA: glycosyltransferase family 39 protein, partial [Thermoanaerobaculia bacterium]|nr:glycosyltransferase family 39 protein [Thermoanaerobaculia bacterium]
MRASASERLTLVVLGMLSIALRAVAFFRYRFDSDEPQHLHVAWGWTVGLLQYRDVFDNHAPLFHILTAPVLSWVGERPDVLLFMRIPMLLLWAAVLLSTYVLGRRLYSKRIGIWSAVLLGLFPTFFLKSLEYRTDNLWSATWMLALVALTGGPLTVVRLFVTGFFIGCALATSLKTILLLLTIAVSAAVTWWFTSPRVPPKRALPLGTAFLIGTAIVPGAVAGWFAAHGALANLWYCTVQFN